jgi:hypothetical protein
MMKRFALFASAIILSTCGAAQLRIDLPRASFDSGELIPAAVRNEGKEPVAFCVEFGQWSYHDDQMETTPIPFAVQALVKRDLKHLFRDRWETLLIGPDIGSMLRAVTIAPGQRYEFPFRLQGKGPRLRLLLYYWQGEQERSCLPRPKGCREIISREFQIVAAPESNEQARKSSR